MLCFRTDETNFAQGDREALRIVAGAGLRVDFDEFAADVSTLGLWHLHNGFCQGEGTGLEDAADSHPFTNHGAHPEEDGYRFVRAHGDYMDAAFPNRPDTPQTTLECWVRNWGVPLGTTGNIAEYFKDANNRLYIVGQRQASPAASSIAARMYVGGVLVANASWVGAAADAILAGTAPWHVAAVFAGSLPNVRLFVNGVQRATGGGTAASLPAGNYTLRLGRYVSGWPGYDLSAVLDEVRLSSTARYAAAFTPHRLLASGAYSSVTCDGVRLATEWADLVRAQTVPSGCAIGWDVRAADATDGGGHPQASWQPYNGDPSTLPGGRYFQWRASLSAAADRLTSPTVTSVEARASEAGYDLYHATGSGPESLDYAAPWARLGPGFTEIETEALEAGTVHWFGIRPMDVAGKQTPTTQGEVRLELDPQGERVADRPAGVLCASARPLPLGAARIEWRYRVGALGVVPQTFRIFGDGGTGTIDYDTPLGTVPCREDQVWYAWTSGPLAGGVEHQLAVRAVTAAGLWDEQPGIARVTPDATAPAEVDALSAETTL